MSSQRDPLRLTDELQEPQPELAAAIRGLRDEHGSADAVLALEQRLLAKLGASALDAAGPDAQAAPGSRRGLAWTVVTLAALGTVFGLTSLRSRHSGHMGALHDPPVSSPQPIGQTCETPAPARATTEFAPVVPPMAAAPLVRGMPHHHRQIPREAAAPQAIVPAPQDPAGELELLQRAQAALRRHDSSAALEWVDQHAHDYPHGVFAQEREVLAVHALLKKQRRPEAIARAEQFIARFADSSYAFRMRSMIEQTPRPAPSVLVSDADPTP